MELKKMSEKSFEERTKAYPKLMVKLWEVTI